MDTKKLTLLRTWMVVHFLVDYLVALPLFFLPTQTLTLLGVTSSPTIARLVAAALFAIGGESLLGRNAKPESLLTMLRLKLIWSSAAIVALFLGLISSELPQLTGFTLLIIFVVFNFLWFKWFRKLSTGLS